MKLGHLGKAHALLVDRISDREAGDPHRVINRRCERQRTGPLCVSSISHSKIGAPDLIQDFQSGDVIDLSQIDAHAGLSGDQAFKWIGSNSFSNQAGELRTYFDGTNTIVEANVNSDAAADCKILVNGNVTLSAVDFLL